MVSSSHSSTLCSGRYISVSHAPCNNQCCCHGAANVILGYILILEKVALCPGKPECKGCYCIRTEKPPLFSSSSSTQYITVDLKNAGLNRLRIRSGVIENTILKYFLFHVILPVGVFGSVFFVAVERLGRRDWLPPASSGSICVSAHSSKSMRWQPRPVARGQYCRCGRVSVRNAQHQQSLILIFIVLRLVALSACS